VLTAYLSVSAKVSAATSITRAEPETISAVAKIWNCLV